MGATCCAAKITSDDTIVVTSSADCASHELDHLLKQLNSVEGDPAAQHQLFDTLQSSGSLLIATLHIQEPDLDRKIKLISYMRALLAAQVWTKGVRLIKTDECKFFVFSPSPGEMLRAVFQVTQAACKFPGWIESVAPELGPVQQPVLTVGVETGRVLLFPGDCYGDPVNIASKLGEDLAKPGEILFSADFVSAARKDATVADLLSQLELTEHSATISKVDLQYFQARLQTGLAPAIEFPDKVDLVKPLGDGMDEEPKESIGAVFVSDMSGFSSLTRTYGILHYLRLVLNVRNMAKPLVDQYHGQIIKYDGDNIIATFPTCSDALKFTNEIWQAVGIYNKERSKDFQIRMGCAIGHGNFTVLGMDIMGDVFERTFHLAEDVSEVQEVLISKDVRDRVAEDDLLSPQIKVSGVRVSEHDNHGQILHHNLEFSQKGEW